VSAVIPDRRRIRARALILMGVALAFYFGFIAVAVYRSHH
jgi:predicted MFS family arabinose efflux permease